MKRAVLLILLLAFTGGAAAQQRTIPKEARRGEMRYAQDAVEIDGERRFLAPGAQIRDADNMVILPGHLPASAVVKYFLDTSGQLRFMWLLTPAEAEASAPPSPFPR